MLFSMAFGSWHILLHLNSDLLVQAAYICTIRDFTNHDHCNIFSLPRRISSGSTRKGILSYSIQVWHILNCHCAEYRYIYTEALSIFLRILPNSIKKSQRKFRRNFLEFRFPTATLLRILLKCNRNWTANIQEIKMSTVSTEKRKVGQITAWLEYSAYKSHMCFA